MSLLYVCDGCDVRAPAGEGHPPKGWTTFRRLGPPPGFTADACARPECVEKVRHMDRAPELVLPF